MVKVPVKSPENNRKKHENVRFKDSRFSKHDKGKNEAPEKTEPEQDKYRACKIFVCRPVSGYIETLIQYFCQDWKSEDIETLRVNINNLRKFYLKYDCHNYQHRPILACALFFVTVKSTGDKLVTYFEKSWRGRVREIVFTHYVTLNRQGKQVVLPYTKRILVKDEDYSLEKFKENLRKKYGDNPEYEFYLRRHLEFETNRGLKFIKKGEPVTIQSAPIKYVFEKSHLSFELLYHFTGHASSSISSKVKRIRKVVFRKDLDFDDW